MAGRVEAADLDERVSALSPCAVYESYHLWWS